MGWNGPDVDASDWLSDEGRAADAKVPPAPGWVDRWGNCNCGMKTCPECGETPQEGDQW